MSSRAAAQEMRVFYGFNVENAQHLGWMRRKLARAARYARASRRPPRPETRRLPRWRQSRRPAPQLRQPLGRDPMTMYWQRALRAQLWHKPMPEPHYRYNAATGRVL